MKITKLGELITKRIKPKLLVKENHLFVFGGTTLNSDILLEVVNLNGEYNFSTPDLFRNFNNFHNEVIALNNMGMLTYIYI